MKTQNIEKLIDYFGRLRKWLKVPSDEDENQKLIKLAEILEGYARKESVKDLLKLIYKNIDEYERHAYPVEHTSAADILKFLMEQNDLTQSDFPEIGGQPHVSKILSGERNFTKDQIGMLSQRFGLSPAVFYDTNGLKIFKSI